MSINTIQSPNNTTHSSSERYDSSSIKVLKGLEAVRKRPGMYIGDTENGKGLHHMIIELVDNAIDEALAGYCSKINVILHQDGSVSVSDNGRGIPVDMHPEEGCSAAEVIMTILHAGGKFDDNVYKVSGGLHGVGVSVVNALSEKLILTIYRDGIHYEQHYSYGKPTTPLQELQESDKKGTTIRFYPDRTSFPLNQENVFDYSYLLTRFRQLAFLNPGIAIHITDEREANKSESVQYLGGLVAFVEYRNKQKPCVISRPFYADGEQHDVQVEVAFTWQESFDKENILCFTNTIPQRDGGTHLVGLRSALTRILNQYIDREGFAKKLKAEKVELMGEDFREGLLAVLSIKVPDPKFSSQTKEKLVSSEVRGIVDRVVSEKLETFLLENPNEAKAIALKAIKAAQARKAALKARQIARKTPLNSMADLPGKLHDCQEKDPSRSELFLVEGKSAGGTVKEARSRRFQAVLPLRGKILNIERISFEKMLSSEEIATLIAALGCGVGYEYNIEKMRYHRIIIMTDADVDGSHIRTLLLTFFYRQFPELIEQGYLYIAHPPLYKLKKGKQEIYLQDDEALEQWLTDHVLGGIAIYEKEVDQPLLTEDDLRELMAKYRQVKIRLQTWEKYYPSHCLQALMELPRLSSMDLYKEDIVNQFCQKWQQTVETQLEGQTDLSYKIAYEAIPINPEEAQEAPQLIYLPCIQESQYSIKKAYRFTAEFFASEDYSETIQLSEHLSKKMPQEGILVQNDNKKPITTFYRLYHDLMQEASKGYSIQRYKGLGEMDWQELLPVVDPQTRELSRVTTADARAADHMVTILMGHIVEDRRQFIEQNALDVVNIDV